MAFLVGGANSASGAYQIDNSLRMYGVDNYGTITTLGSSSSNAKKWTVSFWAKLGGGLAAHRCVFSAGEASGGEYVQINFTDGDELQLYSSNSLGAADNTATNLKTNAKYRDVSAWYHVVYAIDFTDGTAGDRIKLYVNGERVTSFASSSNIPAQNTDNDRVGANSIDHFVGRFVDSDSQYFSGHLSDLYFIDGDAKAASDFGKTDDNGVWIPIKYTGSFGNNGFKFEFQGTGTSANASGIYADTSGNGHHFTPNNHNSTHITTDTPTNNFCTLNYNHKSTSNVVLSEANHKVVLNQSTGWQHVAGTMAVKNGKWYWEGHALSIAATDKTSIGVFQFDTTDVDFVNNTNTDRSSKGLSGHGAGTGSYAYAQGDIVMCGMDLDNNKVYWGKNGTWFGNLDPAAGSGSTTQTISNANFCVPAVGGYGTSSWEVNFGNPSFSISSGNADANGYGNFEYSVPSGYYALCTKNLAEYG